MTADRTLVAAVRRELAAAADPSRAPAMQAYMKSALPYFGVPAAAARKVFAEVLRAHPLPDRAAWQDTVRVLWHDAGHREEWYAALALAGHRAYRCYQDPATLGLYEELVVSGAWWDVVDDLAAHKIGPIVLAYPGAARATVLRWSTAEDLWLRRAAILCQLGAKDRTDTALLAAAIEPSLDDRRFFLRKAIGWALRQHAYTDPDWVREFVTEHAARLSPLSRREALKHLGEP